MVDEAFPSHEDLQLMALSKRPIYIGDVPIYPITLNEISSMKYSTYIRLLRILCIDSDDVSLCLKNKLTDEKQIYDFLVYSALCENDLKKYLLKILSVVCKTDISFDNNTGTFVADKFRINRDNFSSIQRVVRVRNCIETVQKDIENPANDKARELLQKRKMLRKKVQENKSADEHLFIADLVSILSAGLRLPIEVVMEYDIYQFNDQFNRLKIFKDFDVNVQALIHGAESKNIKHWLSKINTKDDE